MNGPYLDVEMQINDLAEFMFTKNVNNVVIDLCLGGIQNNKDLFYFCLDLFCKGLVIMFGNGSNSVDIEDLTADNFALIREKMLCAGVVVKLVALPSDIDDMEGNPVKASLNFDEINASGDNLPLSQYEFKVTNKLMLYIVSFSIVHQV
jgi:hypothetical protein